MNEQKEDVSPKKIERTDGIEEGIHFFNSAMRALDRIEGLLSQIEKTRALVKQLYKDYSGGENIAEETRTTAAQEKNKRERRREEKSAQSDRGSCPTRRAKSKKDRTMLELSSEWKKRNPRTAWES